MPTNPSLFQLFCDLYEQRADLPPLATDLAARVTPSTLSPEVLSIISELIRRGKATSVLELGGGLSTSVIARSLGEAPNSFFASVDHSDYYLQYTRANTTPADRIEWIHAPLGAGRFYHRYYCTYSPSLLKRKLAGRVFDLVLIDGPPGYEIGRAGALYQAAAWLRPDSLVLLDDSLREPERAALEDWKSVFPDLAYRDFSIRKGLTALQIGATPGRRAFSLESLLRSRVRAERARRRYKRANPNL